MVDLNRFKKITTDCISFAEKFLMLPSRINIGLDKCGPTERFNSLSNPCETEFSPSDTIIYFNEKWLENRLQKDPYDVEYFVFHELRHIDQHMQIIRLDHHEKINENPITLEVWRYNFIHYIRNEGGESENRNVRQPVELDAYIYANVLLSLYRMDAVELCPTIPTQIMDEIIPASQKYMNEKQEFREYLQEKGYVTQKAVQVCEDNKPIVKGKKIGANDPCPCGSGKKFKKCCRGNGKYDR